MSDNSVKKRAIFLIGGYEPKSADAFYNRTSREYKRFGETWGLQTEIDPLVLSPDGLVATADLATSGADWNVETEFNFFVWNSLVLSDFARPWYLRLWRYIVAFADYWISGTAFAFFRTNWRFAIYFAYPGVMLILAFLLAGLFYSFAAAIGIPGDPVTSIVLAMVVLVFLVRWVCVRWFVLHLADLWSFSRNYLRNRRSDAERLVGRYAESVVHQVRSEKFDEIILVGHSTGGGLILDIAATALAIDPKLANRNAKVSILTIGSTALKIGLHPAANRYRQKVQTLVDDHNINWVEYQSRTDLVNFYKADPVKEMKLQNNRAAEFPIIRRVRIRDTLLPDAYNRVKRNVFRIHYQFIMANTKHYHYDFFMICCAPLYLPARALDRIVGDGSLGEGE